MWEQETTQGPERGGNSDRGAEKEDITAGTRTHTQEGHTTTEGPAPPQPSGRRTTPGGARPPTHAAEVRIGRHTDHTGTRPPATGNHTGDVGHTCTERPPTPTEEATGNTTAQRKVYSVFSTVFLLLLLLVVAVGCPAAGFG